MKGPRRGANGKVFVLVLLLLCFTLLYGLRQQRQAAERALQTPTPFEAPIKISPDVDVEDKIIVIGKLSTDETDWVAKELPSWKNAIYTTNDTSAPLHTPMNKGKEAMGYLTYIIDNYYNLPATIVFVHSHRSGYIQGWHNDNVEGSNVESISSLNKTFIHEQGYVNLRCTGHPGCPNEIERDRANPSETEIAIKNVWPVFFPDTEQPPVIAVPCCAQFAVSRAAVHRRRRDDYDIFRQWLIGTDLEDKVSGRVFEYLWHIIFGKPARYCPDAKQCFLATYGWRVYIT